MLILDPIPVIIDNLPDDYIEEVEVPFGKDPAMGTHMVPFTKTVYIDRSDFREVDSKDYFRLAPGKATGLLKVPYPIKATTFSKDPNTGLITAVHATYEIPAEGETFKKPKTYIQWVGSSERHNSPIKAEVRIFNPLFRSENPDSVDGGFLKDVNPDSEEVFGGAMVEVGLEEIRRRAPWPKEGGEVGGGREAEKGEVSAQEENGEEGPTDGKQDNNTIPPPNNPPRWESVRFQGLRVAYFAMDKDCVEGGKVVLNRIVSLKEDAGKGG